MQSTTQSQAQSTKIRPWPALWSMVIGFFMLLVDTTIVSVANPAIKAALDPSSSNLDNVVWVTSAYLLAYAVPLLVAGRLGDRFGPKNIYLIGLGVFTAASLWAGLATTLGALIAARAVQGLGAALVTPQTMAVITRVFPADKRGAAMGLWGAVAGIGSLVGPLAGGLLVDGFGWEWIFFVNIPVGIIGFVLAVIYVPKLSTSKQRFDITGVLLSGVALFLIVFGLQEGDHYDWGTIAGPISVWALIAGGVVILGVFIRTQTRNGDDALVPLSLFRDRNFSFSNLGISGVGFAITSMALPTTFFLQIARGLTPTQSALLSIPMAVTAGVLAPFAGRLLDRIDPRLLLVPALLIMSASLFWQSALMNTDTHIWMFIFPNILIGIAQAGIWGPLSTTATRNLQPQMAGAGSGIFNTTRTVGSVIGSAAIASLMQANLTSRLPHGGGDAAFTAALPPKVAALFADAMSQTLLVPAIVLAVAAVFMLLLQNPSKAQLKP